MTKSKKSPSEADRKRISDAQDDFYKLQREIAPYIKVRKLVERSTAGQWQDGSILTPEFPCGADEEIKARN